MIPSTGRDGPRDPGASSGPPFDERRRRMVDVQIAARGVRDPAVLDTMGEVPRHAFVPADLAHLAYEDCPLSIGSGQTISQPFIVAFMTEALRLDAGLRGRYRVLEIGTGSGYGAAVLSRIAAEVYTIERHGELAATAARRLQSLGYDNVRVIHGDGTRGLPAHAPFDAIVVTASGPRVPLPLREQLAIGGRMVIPVGRGVYDQTLLRVTRVAADAYEEETLIPVSFVPLVGEAGWCPEDPPGARARQGAGPRPARAAAPLAERLAASVEPITSIEATDLSGLRGRIGRASLVLLGEATCGSAELHRMRARITRELIEHEGFGAIALEADWPDAACIDHHVRHLAHPPPSWQAFERFPAWRWRNSEFRELVEWLRARNATLVPGARVGVYGLDLYSTHTSLDAVLAHLERIDPATAAAARARHGCLSPWQPDASAHGLPAITSRYRRREPEVLAMLSTRLTERWQHLRQDGERFVDALQRARVLAHAERYYRAMFHATPDAWRLRERHMFDMLQAVRAARDGNERVIVWAHNAHIGNAAATGMAARGAHSLGQLCREAHGRDAYLIGSGTRTGTVAASSSWGGPMEIMPLRQPHERSYERLCHDTGIPAFLLPLRPEPGVRSALGEPRLERMIGAIYRPRAEMRGHYVDAILPLQFDEYAWFDETTAVTPLRAAVFP